jgi:sugar phosphate isomerase/epimerase
MPKTVTRRTFLYATAAPAFLGAAVAPHLEFPRNPRERLSVTSWPFRSILTGPQASIDLKQFPAVILDRFGIKNINPLASHFKEVTPQYITALGTAVTNAGSHIVDLGLGGGAFFDPDSAVREKAVNDGKKWIDIATQLGAPSVRQHLSRNNKAHPADVNLASQSLGAMAEYGAKKNIVVNLENDAPVTEDPFFLVAVIEKVNSPYLRALPDMGNSLVPSGDAARNEKAVRGMFRHVFNVCHVKDAIVDAAMGKVYTVDLARMFAIAQESHYKGYFTMEPDVHGDPFLATQKLITATLNYLK